MKLADFDYNLPPSLIAQHPTRRRADSRMLLVHRSEGRFEDTRFRLLPELLKPGDLLVLNNSRVLPARLFGHRLGLVSQSVGRSNPARDQYLTSEIEVLLTRQIDDRIWEALVKPGRKVRIGEKLIFHSEPQPGGIAPALSELQRFSISGPVLEAEVIGRGEFGLRTLRFADGISLPRTLGKLGHIPLPPYIQRPEQKEDRLRYQTVYARQPGSVAAPTAGLHFTRPMLSELKKRGIECVEITLHVGLGTFQPVRAEIDKHHMHPEPFEVTPDAAARLNRAIAEKRRIIAVGTTTVRTLEHLAAQHGGRIEPGAGETRLFILPGFQFQVVGGLLTNFHLPRTTLLMLIASFAGRDLTLASYEHAVRERYRFYSYGDCMLIL